MVGVLEGLLARVEALEVHVAALVARGGSDPWFTSAEAADYLRVTCERVHNLVSAGS